MTRGNRNLTEKNIKFCDGPFVIQTPAIVKIISIGFLFISLLVVIQGIRMQYKMSLYETELLRTREAIHEYRQIAKEAASKESLDEFAKSLNYAANILMKQQEQIDMLILNRKK